MRFCISALLVFVFVAMSSAQTVTSLVEGNNAGVLSSDAQGPSGLTVSSNLPFASTFSVDFSEDGFGHAVQSPDGSGAVIADAVFANGQTGNYVEARATWSHTATNVSGSSQNYSFIFLITPPSLRIADFAFLEETDPQRPDVFFSAAIHVDGVLAFESTAHLIGGRISHVLNETGTSLNPTYTGDGGVFGYDFEGLSSSLDLGTIPPGGSVTVEYEMVARVDTPGYEAGGRAEIGDPFDLNGTPGFSGTIVPDGPVSTKLTSWGRVKSLHD